MEPPVASRLRAALSFSPIEVVVLAMLGALVVAGASLAWVRSRPMSLAAAPEATAIESPAAPMAGVFVHVVGAVRRPGVYELSAGARGIDAVRAAGGLGPRADLASVNLARILADGEQLSVPRRVPASKASASPAATLVNVNTAGAAELESLPGIGPALAQRIIEHRTANGAFATVRDLLEVAGIGEKTLANLEPYVTV